MVNYVIAKDPHDGDLERLVSTHEKTTVSQEFIQSSQTQPMANKTEKKFSNSGHIRERYYAKLSIFPPCMPNAKSSPPQWVTQSPFESGNNMRKK